jgi:hypothetical protein
MRLPGKHGLVSHNSGGFAFGSFQILTYFLEEKKVVPSREDTSVMEEEAPRREAFIEGLLSSAGSVDTP